MPRIATYRQIRGHTFARVGGPCFCCANPAKVWHHVIQVQHGGRNTKRNLVALCRACHLQIHPWMGTPKPRLGKREPPPSTPSVSTDMTPRLVKNRGVSK